jgi:hypothetical protein
VASSRGGLALASGASWEERMTFAGINYLAIVAAAAAAFFFGFVYYSIFGESWRKAAGLPKKIKKPSHAPLVITFIAELIMAWVLAGLLGHLGAGQVTVRNGVESGAFVWLGFVATTISVNNAFGMRKPVLTVIDAAQWLLVLVTGLTKVDSLRRLSPAARGP